MLCCRRRSSDFVPLRGAEAKATTVVVVCRECLLHLATGDVKPEDIPAITTRAAKTCSKGLKDCLERPERLDVLAGEAGVLRQLPGVQVIDIDPTVPLREPPLEAAKRVHHPQYIALLEDELTKVPGKTFGPKLDKRVKFDGLFGIPRDQQDTLVSAHSFRAAVAAVATVCHATDLVLLGRAGSAFCAVRPPGHHAGRHGPVSPDSTGFCLLNNAATAAGYAAQHYGAAAAIVDFDVHAGNGTQDIINHLTAQGSLPAPVAVFSAHCKGDVYPEGASDDYSFKEGATPAQWRVAARALLKDLVAFLDSTPEDRPRLIVVSAGFDAHENDKTELCTLQATHYTWFTQLLCQIAAENHCKIVSCLEGGYSYESPCPELDVPSPLAEAARAHVLALTKPPPAARADELRTIARRGRAARSPSPCPARSPSPSAGKENKGPRRSPRVAKLVKPETPRKER